MPEFRSTYQSHFADTKDVARLRRALRKLAVVFQDAVRNVSPEFGAYMNYSLFLELGTKHMPARPHIIPAVEQTSSEVLDGVGAALMDVTDRALKAGVSISSQAATTLYANAWIGMLNGPTRARAVMLCKTATPKAAVQYGFHWRSIAGYAYQRPAQEIYAMQVAAAVQRAGLDREVGDKKRAGTKALKDKRLATLTRGNAAKHKALLKAEAARVKAVSKGRAKKAGKKIRAAKKKRKKK